MNNNKLIIVAILAYLFATVSQADIQKSDDHMFRNSFYAGISVGYGATTWGYLIPQDENVALALSTPIDVNENGVVWGFFAGYEFIPTFGLEASYEQYPRARVFFDSMSLFSFEHNGMTSFITDTESISLVGKFMLIIPHNTSFRAYSSVGGAAVHREDIINDKWQFSPKFGVGLDLAVTEHMMIEMGADFTVGNGISELNPANSFIPFLYSMYARFALRL